MLSQPLRELNVEALPLEVPEHIDLDVSHMAMGDTLRLADIAAARGRHAARRPETVVATVTAPTREEEPEEAGRGRGRRGREAAEGEGRGRGRGAGESEADAAGDELPEG